MKRRLKINGLIICLSLMMILIFPRGFFRPIRVDFLNYVGEVVGLIFILLGLIIRVSSRGYKLEHSQQGKALLEGGPYSIVRNPMYLGIFLIGIGLVLMFFQWWMALVFLFIFLSRYFMLIFTEEKNLRLIFPDTYPLYQRKTPRIFPLFFSVVDKDIAEYLPLKTAWIKKESGTICILLSAVFSLDAWYDIRSSGVWAYVRTIAALLSVLIVFIFLVIYLVKRTAYLNKNDSAESQNTL
ncbi:MAG: isoprenylcysteine carboxylmethyltransferase family protein [Candidatus Omnitrophica bacterium]|nr:isoprenylcysteine carboxylmethyltransferase family protein [Candidatus Omnitrophota bacterium]